jgi:saccharopine dehydrogenase-like NADP-dependent oxidoreductase
MRVRVEGRENGDRVAHAWDYVDRYHEGTGLRSMSRSTGYVASSVARLVTRGGVRCRATVTGLDG